MLYLLFLFFLLDMELSSLSTAVNNPPTQVFFP